ncbi:hypothetical protein EV652_103452 [Kribbella steppae]|uniref:Uncharacterized protein n=1 Tax=Kribbella steppae TaxID=2512223 RepID=A0A4R2HQC4_9ACTN|nr:hypothetical protein [Kribbella steppae]TCO33451.1 hypothetical protein EV652_103452 [Kribbella steppae]
MDAKLLPDGRTARFPALGKLSGDWGGGQQLAEEAIWAALTAGHPLLVETVVRLLCEVAPKALPRVVDVPPVVGAALLGLDHTAASPSAQAALRAAFASQSAA